MARKKSYKENHKIVLTIEKNAYGTSKDTICKKEEIKCKNVIKQYRND